MEKILYLICTSNKYLYRYRGQLRTQKFYIIDNVYMRNFEVAGFNIDNVYNSRNFEVAGFYPKSCIFARFLSRIYHFKVLK
jgi:hypothetical protein